MRCLVKDACLSSKVETGAKNLKIIHHTPERNTSEENSLCKAFFMQLSEIVKDLTKSLIYLK